MKVIKGFEGLYSITRDGKIWGHAKKGQWLKLQLAKSGYLLDQLSPMFRTCPVHPEIRMKRKIFDQDLFLYEYHCSKCNTWL